MCQLTSFALVCNTHANNNYPKSKWWQYIIKMRVPRQKIVYGYCSPLFFSSARGLNTSPRSRPSPGRMASGLLPKKGRCRQLSGNRLLCVFEDYMNGLKMEGRIQSARRGLIYNNILLFSFWWYFPHPLCISLRRAKRKKSISGNCDVRIERDNIYEYIKASFFSSRVEIVYLYIYICRYKIIPNVLSSSLIGFLRLNCTIVFKKNMNFFHIPIKRRVLCIFSIKVKCGKNL